MATAITMVLTMVVSENDHCIDSYGSSEDDDVIMVARDSDSEYEPWL